MKNNKTFFFRPQSNLWPDSYYNFSKKKKADYPNSDRHMFSEDIAMAAFPYRFRREKSVLKLEHENKALAQLFMRDNHYSDLDFALHEFMHLYLQELLHDKQIAFEIVKDGNGNHRLVNFPVTSLRYSLWRGKYYQKIPRHRDKYLNTGFHCNIPKDDKRTYFDKNDFFIISTPRILLKTIPSFMKRSKIATSAISAEKFIGFQQSGIPLDKFMYEEDLFRHRIYSCVGRSRIDKQERMTEYYYLLRLLRFYKFSAIIREDLVNQWNTALKTICKKLSQPDNKFVINDILSASDYSELETKLQRKEMTIKEVVDKILN